MGSCTVYSVTGRVAMADPNLQGLPKDFEIDKWEELSQKSKNSQETWKCEE